MFDPAQMIADAAFGLVDDTGWTGKRDVLLSNESGVVIAGEAKEPRSVWWHNLPGQTREVLTAVLPGNSEILYEENASYVSNPPQITIGYPPESKVLTVYGYKSLAGRQQQGNTSQLEQKLIAIGNPHVYSIVDFRMRPTDTTSSSVYIEAGLYERLSAPGKKRRFAGGTLDLSWAIADLDSGQHQLGVTYMDRETEALGVVLGAPALAASALPSRAELDISNIRLKSRQKACGTVYLYYGQDSATIVLADCLTIFDPRFVANEQPGLTSAIIRNGKILTRNSKVIFI